MDKVELLPCPFCGERAVVDETEGSQASGSAIVYRARCERFSCAESPWQSSASEAVKWWNIRSPRIATPARPRKPEIMGDEDGLILMLLNELHDGKDAEMFMSMSDLSDDQARRARNAVRAIIAAARLSPAPEGVDARELLAAAIREDGIEPPPALFTLPLDKMADGLGTLWPRALRAIDAALALIRPPAEQVRMREALEEAETALKHAANTFYRYAKLHRDKETDEGDAKACANASMGEEMNAAIEFVRAALTPPPKGQNDG